MELNSLVILISLGALALFALFITFIKRYKRCPSDKILVVYGKVGGKSTAKTIHGGAAFVWPVIQDYEFLDLRPMNIDVNLTNALSKQNIRVDVPSNFTVAISTDQADMKNAAERLLGMNRQEIAALARDIIFGQLRLVVAMMDIEEINADREKFLQNIHDNLEKELSKVGLHLVNVNIQDITDESGYIDALGKEAAAGAINEAKVSVAKKTRDGQIGEAEAKQDQRTKVAKYDADARIGEAEAAKTTRIKTASLDTEAKVGEAEADKKMRTAVASANAEAIEGENSASITIAKSVSEKEIAKAEAKAAYVAAQNVQEAKAQEESYKAQKVAEEARAEKDKAKQYADVVVPAQIEKEKIETQAEAEAQKIRRIAKGDADAIYAKLEAEARGIREKMQAQADGFKSIVEASGGTAADASMLMISERLPEIIKTQVEAIKDIQIDKITVWDSGQGKTTGDFLTGLLGSVPALQEVFKMTGAELPNFLKGTSEEKPTLSIEDKSSEEEK
jgi:flotillin